MVETEGAEASAVRVAGPLPRPAVPPPRWGGKGRNNPRSR